MTPKVPKEYFKFRKDEILTAAWKCFAEKGYQGTTMKDIAKKLDLSTGVIYNYFKNKDEILDAIMEWALDSENQIFNLMAKKNTAREAISELFNSCFDRCSHEELKESSKANIYIWVEAMKKKKLREMINDKHRQQIDIIANFVNNGIKRGEIPNHIDPKSMAGFYQALITGLQVQSVLIEDFDLTSYYSQIKEIIFRNMWQ
ncbi:TetR/AcrR family transcriptional regulator [Candidatus Neomarinimicrobiota bacterium]